MLGSGFHEDGGHDDRGDDKALESCSVCVDSAMMFDVDAFASTDTSIEKVVHQLIKA